MDLCNNCNKNESVIVLGENRLCELCYSERQDKAKFERDKHVLDVAPALTRGKDALDRRIARNTAIIVGGVNSTNYDEIVRQEPILSEFELIWEKDLNNYETEEKDWIIEGLVPSCSVGVWTGKRGTLKTFLLLNAISCISAGKPFLNKFPTKKGKIIYLDKENGVQIMKQRMPMIKKGLGLTESLDIGFICFSILKIDKPRDIQKLEKIITEHKPSILAVDTYRRGISFEENDAGNVSKLFVEILRPLVEKHKISIILIHHDRKGESQGDEMDMIRGSSDLANYADFILKNERKGKKLIIKQLKMRSAPEMPPIEVMINTDEENFISFDYEGIYEKRTEDMRASEEIIKWIMRCKIKEFKTSDAWSEMDKTGIGETNFKYGLQNLLNTGVLQKLRRGWYKVVEIKLMV